jgi:hypothetical protein
MNDPDNDDLETSISQQYLSFLRRTNSNSLSDVHSRSKRETDHADFKAEGSVLGTNPPYNLLNRIR